jgi:hypothetical protein
MKPLNFYGSPSKWRWIVMIAMVLVLSLPTVSNADRALRCQGRLVYIGDLKADVLSTCGRPDEVEKWEENPDGYTFQIFDYEKERYQLPEMIKGPIQVERWTYDLGANRFTRILFFRNGELIKIERGDKGVD